MNKNDILGRCEPTQCQRPFCLLDVHALGVVGRLNLHNPERPLAIGYEVNTSLDRFGVGCC